MFYCAPVWSSSAYCHIKKFQVVKNKLLKMIFRLPWHYSTQRLHTIFGFEPVNTKVLRYLQSFNERCQNSQYSQINELIPSYFFRFYLIPLFKKVFVKFLPSFLIIKCKYVNIIINRLLLSRKGT